MASERSIKIGNVQIGGGAPVVVQSMTLTPTHDVEATTAQIAALASAGCEVVRCAVPKIEDAEALRRIVRFSPIPVIADIHFNASLALKAIDAGVAAVRINPGNIGGPDKVEQVVHAAKRAKIPMRIGANSGSLPKHLAAVAHRDQAEALVEAALEEVRLLEQLDFRDFKISVKSSHVPTMIRAYRMLAAKVPYPLHLGVTEAGTPYAGSIKSAVGMGALLVDGIGDTIRVSLSDDPADAEAVSHKLLVRGGFVRQLAAGLWSFTALGWRVHRKIEQIIREEHDAFGAQEWLAPVLTPIELWEATGRAGIPELFRLQDRAGRRYVLPLTHEETFAFHARELQSYKQLPQVWYHFQTKDRDEPRPRGGLLRVREFIMKDSYSFDRDEAGLDESFRAHEQAYHRVFQRCGLETHLVQAESGIMGGSGSMDF